MQDYVHFLRVIRKLEARTTVNAVNRLREAISEAIDEGIIGRDLEILSSPLNWNLPK
ncbi:hypothetical protein [Dysgonomonas sp. BGC7]|uniref:hypothetical protein n=1 Tax=Dysgonomonas sp. BGC7 TaxID=1658008 RepID=UPI00161958B7|nr:hypothetical protein [Dysgonomonas sp. BGC7]